MMRKPDVLKLLLFVAVDVACASAVRDMGFDKLESEPGQKVERTLAPASIGRDVHVRPVPSLCIIVRMSTKPMFIHCHEVKEGRRIDHTDTQHASCVLT